MKKADRRYSKSTPEKPPTDAAATVGSKALRTGKLTVKETRSLGGRVESERAAAARKRYGIPKKKPTY